MEDLSEVQDAIKTKLSNSLSGVDAPQLQLYTNSNELIEDLDDITLEKAPQYYQKLTQGGSCVVIGISPPPSRQPTQAQLSLFSPCQIPFYNDIRTIQRCTRNLQ